MLVAARTQAVSQDLVVLLERVRASASLPFNCIEEEVRQLQSRLEKLEEMESEVWMITWRVEGKVCAEETCREMGGVAGQATRTSREDQGSSVGREEGRPEAGYQPGTRKIVRTPGERLNYRRSMASRRISPSSKFSSGSSVRGRGILPSWRWRSCD